MKKKNEIDAMSKVVSELESYAELEGSEWGETVYTLTHMWQLRTLLSKKMVTALESEMKSWLKDVKKNTEIIEELIEPAPYTVKSLEWLV
jgi:hypothetical protein